MKHKLFNFGRACTPYVQLDTRRCKACWGCIESCPNKVIDKIDLPWHKHALIADSDKCTGCMRCVKQCQYEAFSQINKDSLESERRRRSTLKHFLINNLLLFIGCVMIASGLTLQLGFHVGGPEGHQLNRQVSEYWSDIHKFAAVSFSLLMVYHIYAHRKWYKVVISKQLFGKNRQVIMLSVLFLLVAGSGFLPWFIDLSGGINALRFIIIEIHDKIALLLIIFLVLHLIKRNKWFVATYKKIISLHTT